MAHNDPNQAPYLLGEIVDTRPPNQATLIDSALQMLEEHRPAYTTTIQLLQDITEEGDFIYDEMRELKRRHKALYKVAVAALRGLADMQNLGDQVSKEDAEDMTKEERKTAKKECEAILGGMLEVLEKVEEEIGYHPPEDGDESEEEEETEGDEQTEGGPVQEPR